jgi:hypothetical protein
MKIGTIAKETEIAELSFIDGNKSNTNAKAAHNEISIKVSKLNFFIKKIPLYSVFKETHRKRGNKRLHIVKKAIHYSIHIPTLVLTNRFKGSEQICSLSAKKMLPLW